MSRLERVVLHRVRLEMTSPWVSPVAAFSERDVLLVEAVVDGVAGWGECAAQPEPTYSAEYIDGAQDVLVRHLVPRALAAPEGTPEAVAAALDPVRGHPMARTALTAAVLDANLRAADIRMVDHLAALSRHLPAGWRPPPSVPAGVAVGVSGDLDALLTECRDRVAAGYGRLKLKVHPGWDAAPVAAVRDAVGPGVALQVDANGTYAGLADPAAQLSALDDLGLVCIEQPLAEEDLVGHAALARRVRTPLCLDESLTSPGAVVAALALGACGVVNVKPGRLGGLAQAVAVHDLCIDAGVPAWCGGMLETGVGRAANLALAALPGFTLTGDLSAASRYWVSDVVTEPAVLDSGAIAVPTGPGTGVEVGPDLSERTTWSWASPAAR